MRGQKNNRNIQRELFAGVLGVVENAAIFVILGSAASVSGRWRAKEKYRGLRKRHGKMYINFLTQLKNAQAVKKENIKTSYSKMKEKILEVLKDNNYIENFEKKGRGTKRVLDIKLKYNDGGGVIDGIKFVSKPSRRLYVGYKDIRFVKHGYGLLILSTPKGILTGKEARKMKVGGEALFEIW